MMEDGCNQLDETKSNMIRELAMATDGSCNPWQLAGRGRRFERQNLMSRLVGGMHFKKKVPLAECGVNALSEKLCEYFGVAKSGSYFVARQLKHMYNVNCVRWTAQEVLDRPPMVAVRGHGLANVFEKTMYDLGQQDDQVVVVYGDHNNEMIVKASSVAESLNNDRPLEPIN